MLKKSWSQLCSKIIQGELANSRVVLESHFQCYDILVSKVAAETMSSGKNIQMFEEKSKTDVAVCLRGSKLSVVYVWSLRMKSALTQEVTKQKQELNSTQVKQQNTASCVNCQRHHCQVENEVG